MIVLEYILIGVLLLAAVFLVTAVSLQKSDKEGLSGTIVGGAETYYGKDDSIHKDKKLSKWTVIVSIIFAVAVTTVYIIQPNYANTVKDHSSWADNAGDYSDIIESPYETGDKQ
ncbi:MAG: preprotein translocase subunit SecG [Clostridia bacterium]|nr:preprotein translocase subunit SecG [Clostridia bacterium]